MPRDLPGLRWDHDKQRYFSLASPQTPTRRSHQTQSQPDLTQISDADAAVVTIKRRRNLLTPYHALSDLRSVCRTAHKDALIHQIQSSQFSLTDKVERSIIPSQLGLLSAFQAVCHSGGVWGFAGDTCGWFYSSIDDIPPEEMDGMDGWRRQVRLSSEVSSIAVSPTACVATSFGPEPSIVYVPLVSSSEGICILRPDNRLVHDIWTTDLHGSRLVLGANKQAVVIEDIAVSPSLRRLPTHSDVFALAQRENVLYTGLRNGGILRFDTRLQGSNSHPLFDSISQRTSSITGLKHLRDHQLLVSFLDGGISTFDLRFPIRTPLMTFTGNFNSYTHRLPLAIDPHERFLFATGQDKRIRLWSLMTGGPPLHPTGTDRAVFEHPFEHPIAGLQVVEEREMCLWAASGKALSKFSLGRRSEIGV